MIFEKRNAPTMRLITMGVSVLVVCLCSQSALAFAKPKAKDVLKDMSDFLAKQQKLSFRTTENYTGIKRPDGRDMGTVERQVLLERPDKLKSVATGASVDVAVWFRAGSLAIVSNDKKMYGVTKVPEALDEAMDFIAERVRVPMPVSDLLYSSPYDAFMASGTKGRYLGVENVGDERCHHLSFKHKLIEWEIWVRATGDPTPAKLQLKYVQQEEKAECTLVFKDWNFSPEIVPDSFTFMPPDAFTQIRIRERSPLATKSGK